MIVIVINKIKKNIKTPTERRKRGAEREAKQRLKKKQNILLETRYYARSALLKTVLIIEQRFVKLHVN